MPVAAARPIFLTAAERHRHTGPREESFVTLGA
jgi:hypothetical protein